MAGMVSYVSCTINEPYAKQGWEKPGFYKKNNPPVFFLSFFVFLKRNNILFFF